MRRKDREMPPEFGLWVADKCEYGVAAMIDESGMPYAAALNLARDGQSLYFHCAGQGKKTDCLRKNPQVCISFVTGTQLQPEKFTTKFQSAVIRGKAVEVTSDQEKIRALRVICLKLAPSNMADFDNAIQRSLNRTAVWRIDISEITAKEKK